MKFTCPKCLKAFDAERPDAEQSVTCEHCGHAFIDTEPTVLDEVGPSNGSAIAPGKILGGFLIEQKTAAGAMGVVYKARQLSLDRVVALKILPPAFARNPGLVKRFHEETTVLSTLNHPHIVTIIDRGNVGNIYFFVMEYVDGPSLHSIMTEPLDVERFLSVARQMTSALQYAHEHGVVHRDIKPSNVMLNSSGEVKVADFGLAGLMAQERNERSQKDEGRPARMGTPAYMSPEQKADPFSVDGRTDIYSAGMVFFELLSGVRPETPMRHTPSQVCETADPRLDPIVARCLAEDVEGRYQTAGRLLQDLNRFAAEIERAPRCPQCGELSHVRSEVCTHCGADLSDLFDLCPECKQKNRREVHACLHCGVDLEKGRTLISDQVSMMLDQADRLRLSADYDEAVEILDEIQAVEGKTFEGQRERAAALRSRILQEREEAAKRDYGTAKRLVRDRRFREAYELLKSIPADIIDTTNAIRVARQLQEKLAAERRSKATINLILLALGLIMVLVILLFTLLP